MLEQAQHMLREFSEKKVPLIGFTKPKLISIDETKCEIKIPLDTKTQNHVLSLYFGALAIGADITCGLFAMMKIQLSEAPIELLFKDFKADFKKRAMADTHFHCKSGCEIQNMIKETSRTKERVKNKIEITATTPSVTDDEIIATFELTLALKYKPHIS